MAEYYNISAEKTASLVKTDIKRGLSETEALKRLDTYGKNKLNEAKPKSLLKRFAEQLSDYMILILIAASVVSFLTAFISKSGDYIDSLIILAIVAVNAVIGVVQEYRAEKALDALKKLTSPSAYVLRDGVFKTVDAQDVTVGDIIRVKAGDLVPADCRIISAASLRCDESALTGESVAVEKNAAVISAKAHHPGDMKNMLFSSTVVTCGNALALVVDVGMNTQVGKIAKIISESDSPQTPLQLRLAKTGKLLGMCALAICGVIFLFGLLRHIPVLDMFMTSVSLAVAAIPEGLPAVVTVMLAIGVSTMAKRRAIVRKLPAVEALGSVSVICSDKTGTITENKMTVTESYGDKKAALTMACLCSNGSDPTEQAIEAYAMGSGINALELRKAHSRLREHPFSSQLKRMSVVCKYGAGTRFIIKGAPDVILPFCKMNEQARQSILDAVSVMARKALRVIAVAYRDTASPSDTEEKDLVFCGLFGIIDPPRPEIKNAVALCKGAGIRVCMITGDNAETALAIAKQVGIADNITQAVTGSQLAEMSDKQLENSLEHLRVFARVTPEQKVRIVKALRRKGHTVAMTGDGVNDAPSLKTADIGCAMGITGTDVAKGAADMVLTDDNFATIVDAIKEGRSIYDNIKKAVQFLLSSNIGELLTVFIAMLLGFPAPLVAVQLLWINLVTDSLPAISLGVDSADSDIMDRKPTDRRKSIFADGLGRLIACEGLMIGGLSLAAFAIGRYFFASIDIARTMCFSVLSLSQLVHSFNMRSRHSIFKKGIFSNKWLTFSFIICTLLQVVVICVPQLNGIFRVTALSGVQWLTVATLSIIPLIAVETEKLIADSLSPRRKRV